MYLYHVVWRSKQFLVSFPIPKALSIIISLIHAVLATGPTLLALVIVAS